MSFLIIALVWGLFAWKNPRQAILWLPVFLPFYVLRTTIGSLPTTLLELVLGATFIAVTIRSGWSIWRDGWACISPWIPALICWMIASIIAVCVAPNHLAAIGLWRAYILEPILYIVLLAAYLKDETDRRTLLRALLATIVFVALYAIVQFATGRFIPHPWDTDLLTRRATGPFPFPNALSLFSVPLAALFFGFAFTKNTIISTKQAWIGFIGGCVSTILAKSVGGTLGILAAVMTLLIWKKKTRAWTIGVIISALTLIAVVTPLRKPIVDTMTFQGWSGKVRLIIWKETANMLKEHPIFGAGFGAYPDVIRPYHKATYIEIFQFPHNILLNLWSEMGVLGILAFTWIAVTWVKQGWKNPAYLLPLIAILVHGLVDVPYFKNDLAILFWILAVFILHGRIEA